MDGYMKVVRFTGKGGILVTEKPVPSPGTGELLVKIDWCGLCGSERAALENGVAVVPGHESAGTVAACGDGANALPVGSRVVIYLSEYCRCCEACREGDTNRCTRRGRLMGWHMDGGYAEYVLAPMHMVYPIGELPTDLGVLALDTLGTAFHALRQAEPGSRERVLIIGCGPIGLGCIPILRHFYGIGQIFAADPSSARLKLAEGLGAQSIPVDPEDTSGSIGKVLGETRVDIVLEVCGLEATTAAAVKYVKAGGKVVYIGEPKKALHIQRESEWILKDFSLINSWYFPVREIQENLAFIRAQRGEIMGLITHRYGFDRMGEAYDAFFGGRTGKVLIGPRWEGRA